MTARYTMDAKDSTVRRDLAQRAELLGAIRLPNDAFKKNAGQLASQLRQAQSV